MKSKDMALHVIAMQLPGEGWKKDLTDDRLRFLTAGMADNPKWRILGEVSFFPEREGREGRDVLQLYLTLARKVPVALYEKILPRLAELSECNVFGHVGMNPAGEVYHMVRLPAVGDSVEALAQEFSLALEETLTFWEAYYPYLLLVISDPEKMSISEYIDLMIE